MGRGNNPSAYRDMDEEFFASLEEANYECHVSPVKKAMSRSTMSESTILHKHLEHRRAQRNKLVATLGLLVLAGVGSAALYSSVDASAWAVKMRGPYPVFRGSETPTLAEPSSGHVFNGDDSPLFGEAVLASDETVVQHDVAQDDVILDELDPYDQFHKGGGQLENN
ncbi:hypothetical protein PRNP1_011681 [Phytophthora ramorum]